MEHCAVTLRKVQSGCKRPIVYIRIGTSEGSVTLTIVQAKSATLQLSAVIRADYIKLSVVVNTRCGGRMNALLLLLVLLHLLGFQKALLYIRERT